MAGNRIKGITVEIEGETTSLQKSLKEVDASLRDTQKDLKDVNKLLKLDPSNIELLRQKHDLLGQAVKDTEKRQKELNDALSQLKNAGDTEENRRQQDLLQRELIETTQNLDKLREEFNKSMPGLESFATKAGQVAEKTKGISTVATGVVGALVGNAYQASRTADDLNTLSKQTGLSVEELQKMQYASDRIDVSMGDMTGSIAKLTKQMSSGSDVFETLGVEITDSEGNMRSATDVWYDSLEALSKIENETERDALAMDLFGKSANSLAGIVDDGGQALRDMGDEAERNGLILSGEALANANVFNDAIDRLKATAGQAFLEAGASLATTLVPALEKLVGVVVEVLKWFSDLDGKTQAIILTVAGVVASISPLASLFSKITTIVSTLGSVIGFLTSPIGLVVVAITALIAIGVLLYQNWDTISAKAQEVWNNVVTFFTNMWTSLVTIFQNIVQSGTEMIANLANGIIGGIGLVISSITSVVNSIMETIAGFFGDIFNAGSEILAELGEGIMGGVTGLIESVKSIGGNIVSGVWEGIQSAKDAFIGNVTGFFGGIVDNVKGALGIHSPSTVFAEIGKQMGAGVELGWSKEMAKFNPSADLLASASTLNGLLQTNPSNQYSFTNNVTLNGRYTERDGYNIAMSIDKWLGARV